MTAAGPEEPRPDATPAPEPPGGPPAPPTPPSEPPGSPAASLSAAAFLGMGMTVAICIGAGVLLGALADGHFHTAPLFLFVGLVLGIAAGVGSVVALVRRGLS